jgi:hypothetical protein
LLLATLRTEDKDRQKKVLGLLQFPARNRDLTKDLQRNVLGHRTPAHELREIRGVTVS